MDTPVLVQGESGTGKEGVARALHRLGARPDSRYEIVDCTLLDREHLRSELFGHGKGAFTGATGARRGAFERADGGTLLLDEVGELPLEVQGTLLRVLQEGEVRPLGVDEPIRVRVRILAATHRDLAARVAEGRFRADLYYRLAAIVLTVPPLRERPGDALLLARRLLPKGRRFSPEAEAAIASHGWPGNVRELEHAVRRAVALSDAPALSPLDLGLGPSGQGGPDPARIQASGSPTDAPEAQRIRAALAAAKGRKVEAARRLGMARSTLYLKLQELGLGAIRRRGRKR